MSSGWAVTLTPRNTSRKRCTRSRGRQTPTADVTDDHNRRLRHCICARKWNSSQKQELRFNAKRTHTALTCKASISALIFSCSLSYEALSGLPVPYSMSVIVEAGEVVVVVVVVSVKSGVPDVGFGFLFCESLVEAFLVFVGAAMDEEIEDGGRTGRGQRTVVH